MRGMGIAFAVGLVLGGTAYPASAQDWVLGQTQGQAPGDRNIVLTAQGNEAGSHRGATSFTLESSTAYDDWKNRTGENGQVVSESVTLGFVSKSAKTKDEAVSVTLGTAYVWSDATRDNDSGSTSHLADTKLTIGYERPLPGSKTWLGALSSSFNLPTGLTEASATERLAAPAGGVTTASYLGAGFDVGLAVKLTGKLEEKSASKFFVGAGATRRGHYDTTEEDPADADGEVSPGFVYQGSIGMTGLPAGFATLNLAGTYTRNQSYADTISNTVRFALEAARGLKIGPAADARAAGDSQAPNNLNLNFGYTLVANDRQPDRATLASRGDEVLEGVENSFRAGFVYGFGDLVGPKQSPAYRWSLSTDLSGGFGDTSSPEDTAFFSNNWFFGVKAGLAYRIGETATLSAFVKRVETDSESSNRVNDGNTRFSSWTGLIGFNVSF